MSHPMQALTNNPSTSAPRTMRAVVQDSYGSADVFRMDEIAPPVIADDEVLVRVRAAGLDRGTWHLMTGKPYLLRILGFGFRRPKNRVPGLDVGGEVVGRRRRGDPIRRRRRGVRHLSGLLRGVRRGAGGQAGATSRQLSFEQAAVVPISAGTAAAGARRCRPGRSRTVGAGARRVRWRRHVRRTAGEGVRRGGHRRSSPAKLDLVRSLGADHVLDYTRSDFADGSRRYDLILDIGGQPETVAAAAGPHPGGTAVIVGGEEGGA